MIVNSNRTAIAPIMGKTMGMTSIGGREVIFEIIAQICC